jgi:hypothetical protein
MTRAIIRSPVYAIMTDQRPSKHACRLTLAGEPAEVVRVVDHQTMVVRFAWGGLAPVHKSNVEVRNV